MTALAHSKPPFSSQRTRREKVLLKRQKSLQLKGPLFPNPMNFQTKRIRKEPRPPRQKKKQVLQTPPGRPAQKSNYSLHFATAGGGIFLILFLLFGIYWVISSLDFSSIVFSFGKSLDTDETGRTNILLVGTGGEGHDGANLTDTIIVASIDYENKIVPMLSIPRDFYIMDRQQRINSVYDTEIRIKGKDDGIDTLREIVEDVTNLKIQYYAKVDFNGFVEIVDALGGVDVLVENAIYDPYYPKGETIYFETFSLDAGWQLLDGETALKYARSRKTTSDFDRAKRQQQLLFALKEKALSLEILTNAGKIGDIYNSVDDSIETDISLAEIIEIGSIAKDFQKEDIYPLVLNDDPTECGGLIYTPAREFFSGASVLLPAGSDYEYVHLFVDTAFKNIQTISNSNDEIQVLNGTKVPGLAAEGLNVLSRFCLPTVYYGNASERPLETSTIYYQPDEEGNPPAVMSTIQTLMPGLQTQAGIPEDYLLTERRMNSTVVVELGADYLDKRLEDPFKKLSFFTPPATTTTKDDEEETTADEEASELLESSSEEKPSTEAVETETKN